MATLTLPETIGGVMGQEALEEELEEEVKKEEQKKNAQFEGNFGSPEEKIKYYLQKAKENKVNSDDKEKVLIQE